MLQKIKKIVLWYFTVAFVLSGVAVIANGVGGIAGLFWIAGGLLICPKVLPEKKTSHKVIAAIALFMVGVFFMPGENGTRQDDQTTEVVDVQRGTMENNESEKTDESVDEQPEEQKPEKKEEESGADTEKSKSEQEVPPEQENTSEPIGEFTVDELYAELNSNALRAEKTFQDQCILLSGVISGFDSDGKYMSLGKINEGMFDLETVHCSFTDESQLMEALNYNKGDYITLKCVVTTVGEIVGYSVDIVAFDTVASSNLYMEDPIIGEYFGQNEDIAILLTTEDGESYYLSYTCFVTGQSLSMIPSWNITRYDDGTVSLMFQIDPYDSAHSGYVEVVIAGENASGYLYKYEYNALIEGMEDSGGYYSPLNKKPKDW